MSLNYERQGSGHYRFMDVARFERATFDAIAERMEVGPWQLLCDGVEVSDLEGHQVVPDPGAVYELRPVG